MKKIIYYYDYYFLYHLRFFSGISVKAENFSVYNERENRLQQIASKDIKQSNRGGTIKR